MQLEDSQTDRVWLGVTNARLVVDANSFVKHTNILDDDEEDDDDDDDLNGYSYVHMYICIHSYVSIYIYTHTYTCI